MAYPEARFILINFENKFDTLAYLEARFIWTTQFWKWIRFKWIPWLNSRLDPSRKLILKTKRSPWLNTLAYLGARFISKAFENKYDTLAYPEAWFILINFGNKFDTLAYPGAWFISKVHLKINSIPWFVLRRNSFCSIFKANSIPWLIPKLNSFLKFIWK